MVIVSKDKDSIVNLEQVTNLFAGNDGYTIKASFANGSGCQIGRYNQPVATKVIEMIGKAIGRSEASFLPSDEEVTARMNEDKARYHHIDGKKTKGHGGS